MTQELFSLYIIPVVTVLILIMIPLMLTLERKGSAFMQRRVGPNRVGPFGLMQPLADVVKLLFKEDLVPDKAYKILYHLAPAIGILPPFLAMAAIPLAGSVLINGQEFNVQVININVGLLYVLAVTSLHVFSVLTAGWSSNNKFSLLGALRSSSQMVSYEIAIGISVVSVVLTYGTLDLRAIIQASEGSHGLSFITHPTLILPFIILWVSSFAETNRLPFDLPEGESELVAGYHTEYSGLKFAMFFLGEFASMLVASSLLSTLFLGGYNVPFYTTEELRQLFASHGPEVASWLAAACQFLAYFSKALFFMWIFVWVRWTLPRFRYDQLMDLGWKKLLPLGVFNVIITFLWNYFKNRGEI